MARKHEGKFILMVKYGTTVEGYPIGWYAARRCPEVKRGPNPKAALQSNMAEDLSLSADAHRDEARCRHDHYGPGARRHFVRTG
jgi:hypothetical protein